MKKSELKKGANRYSVITDDGTVLTLSADTAEEAGHKAEALGHEVACVSIIKAWKPAGFKGA